MKDGWTTSEIFEGILILLALVWGILLLAPGNVFSNNPRTDLGFVYGLDWFWGLILISISISLLVLPNWRYRGFRRAAHAFYWIFWFAIFCLLLYRTYAAGGIAAFFRVPLWLIGLPFLALALFHAVIYIGLGRDISK